MFSVVIEDLRNHVKNNKAKRRLFDSIYDLNDNDETLLGQELKVLLNICGEHPHLKEQLKKLVYAKNLGQMSIRRIAKICYGKKKKDAPENLVDFMSEFEKIVIEDEDEFNQNGTDENKENASKVKILMYSECFDFDNSFAYKQGEKLTVNIIPIAVDVVRQKWNEMEVGYAIKKIFSRWQNGNLGRQKIANNAAQYCYVGGSEKSFVRDEFVRDISKVAQVENYEETGIEFRPFDNSTEKAGFFCQYGSIPLFQNCVVAEWKDGDTAPHKVYYLPREYPCEILALPNTRYAAIYAPLEAVNLIWYVKMVNDNLKNANERYAQRHQPTSDYVPKDDEIECMYHCQVSEVVSTGDNKAFYQDTDEFENLAPSRRMDWPLNQSEFLENPIFWNYLMDYT